MAVSINVVSKVQNGDAWEVRVDMGDGTFNTFRVRDDADLDRQVLAVAFAKTNPVTLGARVVADPPAPKVPTQDEIDRAAFAVLVQDYKNIVGQVKAGVGKVGQADVDAKVAEIKVAYKDEYAPMLVGVF